MTIVGETGASWDMGQHETGLFDTDNILRFVRHLVNDTKTNQFRFSTLLLMTIGHLWHACKLRSIFYMKSKFLGWSIFGSIDHIILDFPMIWWYLPLVLSLYNLCIMAWFKYTPHTNYDIRCEVSQGGAPRDAVSMCPKTVSRCPKFVSRCPESVSRCPHFFSGTYFTATSNNSQLQALATGICGIQILILVRSALFSST